MSVRLLVLDTEGRGMLRISHKVNNRCHSMQDKKTRNPADFPVPGSSITDQLTAMISVVS